MEKPASPVRRPEAKILVVDDRADNLISIEVILEKDKLRNIPIIFITANNYDEDFMFKGYRMGGVDYIYKPINPELLRAKVAVFVELYSKNQQLMLQEKKLLAEIEERKVSEE